MFQFDPMERKKAGKWLLKLLPEHEFLFRQDGQMKVYKISTGFQLVCLSLMLLFFVWVGHSSYVYFQYNEILNAQEERVVKAKRAYDNLATEITVYKDNLQSLNEKAEKQYEETVAFLEKGEKLKPQEKDKILKDRKLLTAEFDYIHRKVDDFSKNMSWTEMAKSQSSYKLKQAELLRDLALSERRKLRVENKTLLEGMKDMRSAQLQVFDKVDTLAENGIKGLEGKLEKIQQTLKKVGLNNDALIRQAEKIEGGQGGPFLPIRQVNMPTEDLTHSFHRLNGKIRKWEGLSKVEEMLPLGNPVHASRMTSKYGYRMDPFKKVDSMHTGVDFRGSKGVPVYAVSSGKVVRSGKRGAYGNAVEVDHGLGFTTLYAHLNSVEVKKGDLIDPKDKLGTIGSTGRSTAAHLHYEIRLNGRAINPYNFVKARKYVF